MVPSEVSEEIDEGIAQQAFTEEEDGNGNENDDDTTTADVDVDVDLNLEDWTKGVMYCTTEKIWICVVAIMIIIKKHKKNDQ